MKRSWKEGKSGSPEVGKTTISFSFRLTVLPAKKYFIASSHIGAALPGGFFMLVNGSKIEYLKVWKQN